MKEILLTQEQVALVDDSDFERLNQVKWHIHKNKRIFYAVRSTPRVNGNRPTISMHHEVIGKPPKGLVTDHINGNGLDNRRSNLRFVTQRQNTQNKKHCKKSSQYPGVSWNLAGKKWRAKIRINGKAKHLGCFTSEEKAFEAYKQEANNIGETVVGGI